MLRWISSLLVLALVSVAQGQTVYVDDDIIQYAAIDSTVLVDTSYSLWLYIKGPQDTSFNKVSIVYQNQPFTISLQSSGVVWRNDTLFVLTNFGTIASTGARLWWTNTYDDDSDPSSGAISALIMKMKISTEPGDSITEVNWPTNITVMNRDRRNPADSSWGSMLGAGGLPDSVTITGLDSTKNYWFALRSADESQNWSLLSNNAFKILSQGVDSTTTQVYELMTAWDKQNIVGPYGPVTRVEVTIGVLPAGETIITNTDSP